ncbi:MAG: M50 family metallopeptidase [Vicinamibacteria bacterium]
MKAPRRRLVLPLLLGLAFVVLFDSPFVYPFRLFVVFLHEISHGVAAVLTGGRVVSIGLGADEGGVCVTRGGWPFLILNAGYLGSLLWGAAFLLLGRRPRSAPTVVGVVGAVTLAVAALYVRTPFGLAYTVVAGLVLLLVAAKMPPGASEVLLAAIGAMSVLYAVADITSDVLRRYAAQSDAAALARLTHVPAVVWGVAWIAISLAVLVALVRRLA